MEPALIATRPKEVLCLFPVEFPTQEGDAYFFLAMDVYSEFLIHTGTEKSNNIECVLKHIGLLLQHKDLERYKNRPFTLVLHKHEEFRTEIEGIIKPYGGTLVVSDAYLSEKMMPAIEVLFMRLAGSNNNG
ncbi:MAG TPA: hypothetical protein VGB84_00920 [Arachidicoccus sp.]